MAWHGDPSLHRRYAYSGDYGIGLYGYWRSAAAYLDCSAWRGCMLCDIVGSPQADGAEMRKAGCVWWSGHDFAPRRTPSARIHRATWAHDQRRGCSDRASHV